MKVACVALCGALFVALLGAMVAGSGSAAKAAPAGDWVPFERTQVDAGAKIFATTCATCHGADLQGGQGPSLGGTSSAIGDMSVSYIYGFISRSMPLTAPGSLSAPDYVKLVAFLLDSNGRKPNETYLDTVEAGRSTATIAPGT